MSFTVETVPFDATDQKDFVLSSWQIASPLDVGSSWNTIRIGMRYALTDAGASLGSGPELWFGVLSSPSAGMANGPLTTSTSNFAGVRWDTSWTRATTPTRYSATGRIIHRTGSTDTTPAAGSTVLVSAEQTTIKGAAVVILARSGADVSTVLISASTTAALVDSTMTKDGLIAAMNASATVDIIAALDAVTGGGHAVISAGTLSPDEASNGVLNSICIAWNSGLASLHASEAFFRVVA